MWWDKHGQDLARFDKLAVFAISDGELEALSGLAGTNLTLQCTISEGELWITDGDQSVEMRPRTLKEAEGSSP